MTLADRSAPVHAPNPLPSVSVGGRGEIKEAVAVLNAAADQFAFYADEHVKKRTPEAVAKAQTNHGWALKCARVANALHNAFLNAAVSGAGPIHLDDGAGLIADIGGGGA